MFPIVDPSAISTPRLSSLSLVCCTHGAGAKLLNPSKGCLEQLVMNFRNFLCWSGFISFTTSHNHCTMGWDGWSPPEYLVTFIIPCTSIPCTASSPLMSFWNSYALNSLTHGAGIMSLKPCRNAWVCREPATFILWWDTRWMYWITFSFVTRILLPPGMSSTVLFLPAVVSNVSPRLLISEALMYRSDLICL